MKKFIGFILVAAIGAACVDTECAKTPVTRAKVIWDRVLSDDNGRYIGWPTAIRTAKGELLAVYSGDRDAHVCPHGKVRMVRSADEGESWTRPVTICDGPLDDRDAGILELPNRDLVLFWFTSLAYHERGYAAYRKGHPEYETIYNSIPDEEKRRNLGSFVRRSTDGGKTWSEKVRVPVSAPHGGVLLKDGRILLPGSHNSQFVGKLENDPGRVPNSIKVAESTDGGRSFHLLADLPEGKFDQRRMSEPTLFEAEDGTLTILIRWEQPPEGTPKGCRTYPRNLLKSVSHDGGKTWSQIERTPVDGYPPHVLRLRNGNLLLSYTCRIAGRCGIYAVISYDDGKTWAVDRELAIRRFETGDIGYPSTVENPDGTLLTVYYGPAKKGAKNSLLGTKWRME